MRENVRSLTAYRRNLGFIPIDGLHARVARRSPQAGRLVDTLDGCVKNSLKRAQIGHALLSALELLPLEQVAEKTYLDALRVWFYGRNVSDDPALAAMIEEGRVTLSAIDREFSDLHERELDSRFTEGERSLIRGFFSVVARAATKRRP